MRHQPGIERGNFSGEPFQPDGRDVAGTSDRQFIEALLTRDHHRRFGAEQVHGIAVECDQARMRHADQLAGHPGRIGQRAGEVEDRAVAQCLTDRREPGQRRVVRLREQKGDAKVGQGLLGHVAGALQVKAQRLESVGAAGEARGGAVAMLGDWDAASRDHQGHGS